MSRSSSLPVLELGGEPYELGYEHGTQAQALVAHNLGLYFRRFREEVGLARDEVLRRAGVRLERLESEHPDYAAMVAGIADGAGLPILDIAALNARYELFYGEFAQQGLRGNACTAFALLPGAAGNGHLLLGENWDWFPGVAGLWLHIRREGLSLLCFTEAGIAGGKIGLNSAGVGLCLNGLVSHLDRWDGEGMPLHVRCWEILSSGSAEAAAAVVEQGPSPCSANFLLAQAGGAGQGAILDLERTPTGTARLEPKGGFLVHANHFLAPEKLGVREHLAEERHSTYLRQRRMEELLAQALAKGRVGVEVLQGMLGDHEGFPDSVCRHPDPALPAQVRYGTVLSAVMDLHERRIWYTSGPCCQTGFHELSLAP